MHAWASISIQHWGGPLIEAPKAPRSNAEGVRIEAPRGVGCADGVSPSPLGEGSGEGAVPPPRKLFDCGSQNGEF